MPITQITPYASSVKFNRNKNTLQNNNPEYTVHAKNYDALPSTHQFLSFKGGKSIDLGQTIEALGKIEQKYSLASQIAEDAASFIPERVVELAKRVLDRNNPKNLTLIDIHKIAYNKLKNLTSLDEVKKVYPEFKNILSAKDVDARNGSFVDVARKGTHEYFDDGEDLSLQLLKLYWGEGLSLNQLAPYSNDLKTFSGVLKKLQIPHKERTYGHYLTLSDVEANKRITALMSEKQLEAAARRDGFYEIAALARGQMTEEHKTKISQALVDYYAEHPEKIYERSQRQKEFFKNNKELSGLFSLVVKRAWELGSSRPIKEAVRRFGKSADFSQAEKLEEANNVSWLKEFWDTNPKAKKQFSASMKSAWKQTKEQLQLFEVEEYFQTFPQWLRTNIAGWAKAKKGYDPDRLVLSVLVDGNKFSNADVEASAKIITEYFSTHVHDSDKYANQIGATIMLMRKHYEQRAFKGDDFAQSVLVHINHSINPATHPNGHTAKELRQLFSDLINYQLLGGYSDDMKFMHIALEKSGSLSKELKTMELASSGDRLFKKPVKF